MEHLEMNECCDFMDVDVVGEPGLDYLPEIIVAGACLNEIMGITHAPGAMKYTLIGFLAFALVIWILI